MSLFAFLLEPTIESDVSNDQGLSHEFNDLFLYGPTVTFISTNLWVEMQLLVLTKVQYYIPATSLLENYTRYVCRILHKKSPFRHNIATNVFPHFMPVGHIATAGDFGNADDTNDGIT